LAIVHPPFSGPTRVSPATTTFSRNVSQNAGVPPVVSMGFTRTPGVFMSIRRKLIPACFLAWGSVRTRQNIQSAYCAYVVHVFCPLTTKFPLPSSSARH
jgi:hypothetical protein